MLPKAGWEEIFGRRSSAAVVEPGIVDCVDCVGRRETGGDNVVLLVADRKMEGRREGREVYVLGGGVSEWLKMGKVKKGTDRIDEL